MPRLTLVSLARSGRRGGTPRNVWGAVVEAEESHGRNAEIVSSLGKYTKAYANLPERFVVRRSAMELYRSADHPAARPELRLSGVQWHGMERPWSDEYWRKYGSKAAGVAHGTYVRPIKESEWMWFRGDRVEVLKDGPDKGKQGYVNYIVQERNWVCVEGLNCGHEVVGATRDFPGVVQKRERPLDVLTEIKLVDPSDERPADKVEWRFTDDGERVRVSVRTGHIIPIPSAADSTVDYHAKAGYAENDTKDTKAADVEEITFEPKLRTFDMDIMESMGISEARSPAKTYWY